MNALLPSSGTTDFNPSFGDFILEAYSRIQVRPPSLTSDHFIQARMSANLLLTSEWVNIGMPLLYKIVQLQIPLSPGVANYTLPSNIVAPLDAFIRTYQTGQAQNFVPIFATAAGSLSVIVTQLAHGLATNDMVYYPMPIAASGIIIQGPYIVTSVVDPDHYEITVTHVPDGTGSVAVPVFAALINETDVAVHLPAHGLSNGQQFYINLPTTVGGISLSGNYTVVSTPGPDDFAINAQQPASSSEIVAMNAGLAQAQTQLYNVDFLDYILYPISRTDYASQADKDLSFRPTTFWFQRKRSPVITFWNKPDNNVYVFNLWVMQTPDDIETSGGVGVDLVQRYNEAFASGLAAKLIRKFPEAAKAAGVTPGELKAEADAALIAALKEDIERTAFFISPGLSGYYR